MNICVNSKQVLLWCDNPLNECNFVNVDEIKDVVSECMPLLEARVRGTVGDAQSRLSAISQLPVWSAFFDFDIYGCPHGIFGSCPFERLHAWQTGLMKNAMEKLFLLSDLPDIFLNWYYDDNSVASSHPRVNITDVPKTIKILVIWGSFVNWRLASWSIE